MRERLFPFWQGKSLAEALLVPTRIYVKPLLAALRATGGSGPAGAIKGLSHITGGGLSENLPRIMPAGLAAHVDLARIAVPNGFVSVRPELPGYSVVTVCA